jgi:protein involved in polysaccharide export with SLBB domain
VWPREARHASNSPGRLRRLLDKDYFYDATVIVGLDSVSAKSRGRIYIWGQVRNQGALEIPSDEAFTVSRAILRAGGFADFANRKAVKLTSEKTAINSPSTS